MKHPFQTFGLPVIVYAFLLAGLLIIPWTLGQLVRKYFVKEGT